MAKKEKQEEEQTLEAIGFTEAPASINVKFLWQGFDTMLTIRDEKVNAALAKYRVAIEYLEKMGATPTPGRGYANAGNANGQQAGGNGGEPDSKVCPLHHVAMRKREKQGETWWSHRAINPDTSEEYWCRGKAK